MARKLSNIKFLSIQFHLIWFAWQCPLEPPASYHPSQNLCEGKVFYLIWWLFCDGNFFENFLLRREKSLGSCVYMESLSCNRTKITLVSFAFEFGWEDVNGRWRLSFLELVPVDDFFCLKMPQLKHHSRLWTLRISIWIRFKTLKANFIFNFDFWKLPTQSELRLNWFGSLSTSALIENWEMNKLKCFQKSWRAWKRAKIYF